MTVVCRFLPLIEKCEGSYGATAVVEGNTANIRYVPKALVPRYWMNGSYRESRPSNFKAQGRQGALSRHLRINVTAPVRAVFFE